MSIISIKFKKGKQRFGMTSVLVFKFAQKGLPWWSSSWESTSKGRDEGLVPGQWTKIQHANKALHLN